jgi:hypothetical protein
MNPQHADFAALLETVKTEAMIFDPRLT